MPSFIASAFNKTKVNYDEPIVTLFNYYGIESYFQTGAIAFCMNELMLLYTDVDQVFDVHSECINLSDNIVKTSKCETINNNRTDLIYASSSSTVDRAVIV